MVIEIQDYGNGYRPSATGRVDELPFIFRMSGDGAWAFGVGRDATTDISWLNPSDDLHFVTDGPGDGPYFHTDSLRWFLEGLARYARSRDVSDIDGLLRDASEQAARLFAREP